MRRIAVVLITGAVAAGLCGLAAVLWGHSASFLAETWQEELERAPEHRVDAILDRLAGLDEAAIPALALALTSSRERVSRGAARILRRQSACWQAIPADIAAKRRRRLAQALAVAWPHLGPVGRRDAAEIVGQLLSVASPESSRGDAEFLAACAEVLRAGASSDADAVQGSARPPIARPALSDRPAAAMDGTKPLEAPGSASASDNPVRITERKALQHSDAPAPLPPVASAPDSLPQSSALPSAAEAMAGPSVNSTSAASNEPRRLSPLRQAGFEDRSSREGDADTDPKDAVDLRQVARRLNDEKPQQAEAARKELQSRGFSAVEVDVARQLLHPDAAVRRKLARSLPETVGVDAAPWLLELSRDPDADVRLEAMTLLVTTGDPVLLDALRKLVAADPDERIQRLSVRLSRASLLPEKNVTK